MIKYYIWPDGTCCEEQYLSEYILFMGDDYTIIEANSEEEALKKNKNQ